MTIHFAPDLEQQLEQYAANAGRTSDDVAQEAVNQFLLENRLLDQEVADAEAEADRNGWLAHEEVFLRLRQRIAKAA